MPIAIFSPWPIQSALDYFFILGGGRKRPWNFLGKDAENFATKQQRTFTVLSLATKSGYKDKKTGQWVNHTEWHRIVAFAKPAEYARGLKKGDYLEIEGELRSTEFDVEVGEGKKKTIWEIRVNSILKLDRAAKASSDDPEHEDAPQEEVAE